MRISLAVAVACLTFGGLAAAGDATAAIRKSTEIPAEGLGPALTKLAKEFDFQVLYRTEVIGKLRTEGASGAMTAEEALEHVLSGTGLTYKYLDDKTVTIVSRESSGTANSLRSDQAPSDPGSEATQSKEAGKKSSRDFRVAQVDQGKGSSSSSVGEQASPSQTNSKSPSVGLEEIIVTAQKRSQRLQDVPVPVTAISAESLLSQNVVQIRDYYSTVPGLNLGSTIGGFYTGGSALAIRGVNTGAGDPTVSMLIDDAVYPARSLLFGVVPDIDPGELDHIEVLRGPQGTLYGANSMGGLVKYATVDPSTAGISGRLEAGANGVYNGAQVGYITRASINLPVSDTIAVRASAFARQDPGYVDNVANGEKGVNEAEAYGARVSTLWRPSDVFSLKLSALFQYNRSFGSSETDIRPGLGDLQQDRIPGTGTFDAKTQLYSAIANLKLGAADLTSVTAVNSDSYYYGAIDFSYAVPGLTLPLTIGVHTYTEDLRLSMPLASWVDCLVGVYYDYESNQLGEIEQTSSPAGAVTGFLLYLHQSNPYTEFAGYTDFTFHVTDRFDVQVGGRASSLRQTASQTVSTPGVEYPTTHDTAHPVTYLFTPSFKVLPDLMVYARLASGYRAGGTNNGLANAGGPSYASDSTKNYELGVKGAFFDHRLSIDVSAYYIDWKNLQLAFLAPNNFGYYSNGSAAKSEGVELSVETRPVTGMAITGWVAYDDAVITERSPPGSSTTLVPGDRLPLTSRVSANLAVSQEFPLLARWTGVVGANVSYVGDRIGAIGLANEVSNQWPSYVKTDFRAGARYEGLELNLFFNNVADKRGVIGGGPGSINPAAYYYIQPRTIGLNISKTF